MGAGDTLREYNSTAASNTSLGGINLSEGVMVPSDLNNSFREIMSHLADAFANGTEAVSVINSPIVKATNTNTTNTGTSVAIQIGASTDWTVVVTSSDELVFRHNGNAKMLLTNSGHLKVIDDITAFADLSAYNGA
ncbi:MAG: hypothetical protein DWQ28_06645 [Proteobacteria bacterium]|nr:MAG: hypothetical protein DWQ28_06340 [Pseudomonadota bacterium]REJ67710.1 MAG: hypothetical protein DWQ28_06645 [Pseudomonadota bacterium]